MIAFLKKSITGISIPQEYICVGLEELGDPLVVFLDTGDSKKDISKSHLFVGYKPLVIGLICEKGWSIENIKLDFEAPSKKEAIAALHLKRIGKKEAGSHDIIFFEGVSGQHRFISTFHQFTNGLVERLRRKSSGNVSLGGNLYDQVRISYSIPRKISVVVVANGELMNTFPTDLHGPVGSDFYASSLRITGEACKQVIQNKKIVISEVDCSSFKEVYALGKNHIKPMRPKNEFTLSETRSDALNFPLPRSVGVYRELEVMDYFDVGIHRIFIYKIIGQKNLNQITTLSHVHQYYVQWRKNQNLETKSLFR